MDTYTLRANLVLKLKQDFFFFFLIHRKVSHSFLKGYMYYIYYGVIYMLVPGFVKHVHQMENVFFISCMDGNFRNDCLFS